MTLVLQVVHRVITRHLLGQAGNAHYSGYTDDSHLARQVTREAEA